MTTTKFSNILLDKSPKKINNITENILDVLFQINEVVRELNSVDFCNPLGYILTRALPPEGLIDNLLKEYGKKVTVFINTSTKKLELNNNTNTLPDDIEELRLSLEDLILPEELKDIIPGADGLTKLIQDLNDSLVITNTLLSNNDKKTLIKSFTNRLIPLSNPINLTEALLSSQADSLNRQLRNIIRPEQFRNDLLKLIKLVIKVDKSIVQIQNIIILMNKIIKAINVLIKVFKISSRIIQKLPMPAKYMTSGAIVTSSTKVAKFESDISDLEKLLNSVSIFLSTSVIKQIKRIRNEIFILLIGLNQLYENISACPYFTNSDLLGNISDAITTLNNDIILLDELFPSVRDNINTSSYKGYNISIIKEETTDNNTSLIRRRVIVTNSQDIIEYESTPTFSNDDQILIKEGQYYIDSKSEMGTSDNGTDNITNEETSILLSQIGMDTVSLEEAVIKENEINETLYNQIQNNPEDKKIYDSVSGDNINPNPKRVEQIKRVANIISNQYNNSSLGSILLQNRLKLLADSLLKKGYTPEEIESAFKYTYSDKFNIRIINNNITISRN